MPEKNVWVAFQELSQKLKVDTKFAETFDKNPTKALRDGGFDITVPATTESATTKLSDLMQKMTPVERRATIDAIVSANPGGPGRVAAVTPVANANAAANANAGANANAIANANANANANTNTNGSGGAQLRGDLLQVRIDDRFRGTDLAKGFQGLQLSEARQAALLKSVLSDSMSVVESKDVGGVPTLRAVSSFRGLSFEVEATVRNGEVTIAKTRVLK
jgi:hypothetical protein